MGKKNEGERKKGRKGGIEKAGREEGRYVYTATPKAEERFSPRNWSA